LKETKLTLKRQKIDDAEDKHSNVAISTTAESNVSATADSEQRKRGLKEQQKSENISRRNSNVSVIVQLTKLDIGNDQPNAQILPNPTHFPVNPLQ
jgi:hypothetical protein